MKKFLSCAKTTIILLIVTVLALGLYAYMLIRPISYGMEYHNVTEYDGGTFEGTFTFYHGGKMIIKNTNLKDEVEGNFYYKDGYIFDLAATTEEEKKAEIEKINKDFEGAVNKLFYASKISAFELVPVPGEDGYTTVYTCNTANTFAIAGGVVVLVLIGITCTSAILCKKNKREA